MPPGLTHCLHMPEPNKRKTDDKIRVMFVCLGNICRSPLAAGVFLEKVRAAGLADRIEVASSGTGHWHVGQPADARMRQTAQQYGCSLEAHRAQQFDAAHLEAFDYVFVMDKDNLHDVLYLDRGDRFGNKVRLFREFDPEPGNYQVPDPYYGGPAGFDEVYRIVSRTAERLLERLIEDHGLEAPAGTDR
jgi:protein-tyrosine phosphatase